MAMIDCKDRRVEFLRAKLNRRQQEHYHDLKLRQEPASFSVGALLTRMGGKSRSRQHAVFHAINVRGETKLLAGRDRLLFGNFHGEQSSWRR